MTGSGKDSVNNIRLEHDRILAECAFPKNKKSLDLSRSEMATLIQAVTELCQNDYRWEIKLSGTGIPGTELTGSFSYSVTKWLWHMFPEYVTMDSATTDPETVRLFFRQLLPRVEYELISTGELSLCDRIKKLKGKNKTTLRWLIELFENSRFTADEKEFIFSTLNIFITWKLNHPFFSRSLIRLPVKKIYYPVKTYPQITNAFYKKKLPRSERLSAKQKQLLINVARASLVFLYRETEPFTHTDPTSIELFQLESGLSIGLYGMRPEQRHSIDTYIGYFVFSNGIPVAYGGGWIFGERCQFGINILPPFRGNHSALIMAQLIRLYSRRFRVNRFVIKPYQFGKQNKEGLTSGAFWFYYKLGFRPDQEALCQLAIKELRNKKEQPMYRSSEAVLKKFTAADMVLDLSENPVPVFDASLISSAVTDFIIREFDGDRKHALRSCTIHTSKDLNIGSLHEWRPEEIKCLEQWSLITQALLSPTLWNSNEKNRFIRMIRLKSAGKELDFIKLLQRHRAFWNDLLKKLNEKK